ncbi:MAG: hypothetical protein ACP5KE_02700 [Candidatus Methanodesulfokora sp.]
MIIGRAGLVLIFLGISTALGLVLNPTIPKMPRTDRTTMNPGETVYTKMFLMGSDHVIRILVPDGFNGSFALLNANGDMEVRKDLSGPVIEHMNLKRRGWYILVINNFSNETAEVTHEIAKTNNPDWSAIFEALIMTCIGLFLFLYGKVSKRFLGR